MSDVPTATQSEQLAVVVATVAVAALAVDVAVPSVALVAASGFATAAALRYVDSDDTQVAAAARCVGALGIVGGAVGVIAAFWLAADVSTLAAVVASAGAWVALVATASVIAGTDAGDQFRSAAWTSSIAGVGVGVAAVTGLGALVAGTSPAVGPAAWLWAIVRWLVSGGQPGNAIPILLAFLSALCVVAAVTPPATPPKPRVGSELDAPVVRADSLRTWLSRGAIGFFVAATVTYLLPVSLAIPGFAAVFGYAVRGVLLVAIVSLLLAAVTGAALKRWVWPNGRPLRGVGLSIAGGSAAALVLTVLTGSAARVSNVDPWIGLAVIACVAIGTIPVLEGVLAVSGLLELLRRRAVSIPAAALLAAAAGATQYSATIGPIVAVGAALVVWDSLSYRRGLRAEVFRADTAEVERRRLGATLGVVTVAVVASLFVAGVTSVVRPSRGGEPLVVVVAGAVLLAVVTVALGRWNPT